MHQINEALDAFVSFSVFDFDNVEGDPAPVPLRFVRGQPQHGRRCAHGFPDTTGEPSA
jgi:hypothetical protein